MISIRSLTAQDLLQVQECNLFTLPENYQFKYYAFHLLSWPQLSHVAITSDGQIVGYVLAKLEEDSLYPSGHLTSVAVRRDYRRLGIAEKLLRQSLHAMAQVFRAESASLHVRQSNIAALTLYRDKLGFEIQEHEPKYYADGEDAFLMRKSLL